MDNSHIAFLIILALVGAGRLLELRKSKQHLSRDKSEKQGFEYHYVLMVAIHTLLFILPPLELYFLRREFLWPLALASLALVGVATLLRLWVIRSLGASWNTRGLVSEDIQIVSHGPYRWLRHPNYVAVIIEIAALPLIHSAYWSAAFLSIANGIILAIRIPWEEEQLFKIPGYAEAFNHKRRFIPILGSRVKDSVSVDEDQKTD
ncbi:MAG: isoprenylcysteine carboxylmethyltransferase family protein [Planctomycetota bacterium]|nr:isoprenylcysteine carboxylmethyltransferase family protein [Planctomycetota bacterium]